MQKKQIIREELKKLEEDRKYNFEATFSKVSHNKRFHEKEHILLLNVFLIKDDGSKELMTDHIWTEKSKRWKTFLLKAKENDLVSFSAEIKTYIKEGKRDYFEDTGLKSFRNVIFAKEV